MFNVQTDQTNDPLTETLLASLNDSHISEYVEVQRRTRKRWLVGLLVCGLSMGGFVFGFEQETPLNYSLPHSTRDIQWVLFMYAVSIGVFCLVGKF